MPCTYYTDSELAQQARESSEKLKKELDLATRLLCHVCTNLPPIAISSNPELSAWWDRHKDMDAQRRKDEAEAAQKEKERLAEAKRHRQAYNKAHAKLTPEERLILGVRPQRLR